MANLNGYETGDGGYSQGAITIRSHSLPLLMIRFIQILFNKSNLREKQAMCWNLDLHQKLRDLNLILMFL
ncbi:MAG: hypothetical protein A2156_15435 [Deltaproteobacteria bacterium RBG_16_48_10]|nr:MAG: hypothetical protein A2156_15435 [Deltaproteobacteria bacterium RBG_16_48_10]